MLSMFSKWLKCNLFTKIIYISVIDLIHYNQACLIVVQTFLFYLFCQGLQSLCDNTGGTTLYDVIRRASHTSKRQLLAPPPTGPGRGGLETKSQGRVRSKRDRPVLEALPLKEECDMDETGLQPPEATDDDDEDQSFPSLARYVTMACGEVKKEVSEDSNELRGSSVPIVSAAKRRLVLKVVFQHRIKKNFLLCYIIFLSEVSNCLLT